MYSVTTFKFSALGENFVHTHVAMLNAERISDSGLYGSLGTWLDCTVNSLEIQNKKRMRTYN